MQYASEVLYREAKILGQTLPLLNDSKALILNLGSGTEDFRSTRQPYINRFIFSRLVNPVVHSDLQNGSGVQVIGDFQDPDTQGRIRELGATIILASNLLEHLMCPLEALRKIESLVPQGGYLVLSGPARYPYHPDPIDNGFRPTREFLPELLGDFQTIKSEVLRAGPICVATRRTSNWLIPFLAGVFQSVRRTGHPIQSPFFMTKFYIYVGKRI